MSVGEGAVSRPGRSHATPHESEPVVEREAVRNALLRRADWRVLLANPKPARAVCFASGTLAQAVELLAETVVSPAEAATGSCDLAVVLDPDQRTLAAAAARLRPGGSLYVEWSSPAGGWFRRARRRFEALGFADVLQYWPWPPPERRSPMFWLPVDARGANHYFAASRTQSRYWGRRPFDAARRTAWRTANRVGYTFPLSVAATLPDPASPARELTLQKLLAPPGASTASRRSLLLLTPGQRSVSKVVGLAFEEPDPRPRYALKFPRTPEAAALLEHEADVLRKLVASAHHVSGVPRVEFEQEHGRFVAVGETFVDGTPLFELIRPSSYQSLALAATHWVAELAGSPPPAPREAWWPRLVDPILADFRAQFGRVVDPQALEAAETLVASLATLPVVCEHRDYAPWNILVSSTGELGVLDWEGAELRGLPGVDLIYFLAYHAFFLDGALVSHKYRASLRACFEPSTFTGRVTSECLALYASKVGLDASSWPALRVLVWMLKARAEYRRFVEDVGGPPTVETLRSSVFVQLWETEVERLAR